MRQNFHSVSVDKPGNREYYKVIIANCYRLILRRLAFCGLYREGAIY
jgi:hypothetical protein